MKKTIAVLLALTVLLSAGCSKKQPAPTAGTQAPTVASTAPTETEAPETTSPPPETVRGIIRGVNIPAVLSFPRRGDTVQVTGYAADGSARVQSAEAEGILDKALLHFAGDPDYDVWEAYAGYAAALYAGYTRAGTPLKNLGLNEKVQVLDEIGGSCLVRCGEQEGYIAKAQLSKWQISATPGGSEGGEDGGSSGSNSGSSSRDGGDISLTGAAGSGRLVLLSQTKKTGAARIRADGGRVILKFFDRGDPVALLSDPGLVPEVPGYVPILEDGVIAYIPADWVELPGSDPFTAWEGYAGYQCKYYECFDLPGDGLGQRSVNEKLTVLWQSGETLLAQSGDAIFYTVAATVRTTPLPTGSASDGGSGDSGSASSADTGDAWTPPKL